MEELDDEGERWDEEFKSYWLTDIRIQPTTVVDVYVRSFYTNTGDPYYVPFNQWSLEKTNGAVVYQIGEGFIRFFDTQNRLRNQVVAIAVTGA